MRDAINNFANSFGMKDKMTGLLKSRKKIILGFVLFVVCIGMSGGVAQINPTHVGSFNWRGGLTGLGSGEFLYGTLTLASNGKIAASYYVPRYGDRNTFSGTIKLSTGAGSVTVRVNGAPQPGSALLNLRSKSGIYFNGTFKSPRGGGIFSGFR